MIEAGSGTFFVEKIFFSHVDITKVQVDIFLALEVETIVLSNKSLMDFVFYHVLCRFEEIVGNH